MNNKEIYREIEVQINQGRSKQEVFESFRKIVNHDDTLAKMVGSLPDKKLSIKYGKLNYILFLILLFTALIKVLLAIPLVLSIAISAIPLLLVIPLLNLYFAVKVYKKRGYIYGCLGFIAISGIFQAIGNIKSMNIMTIINVLLMGIISALSFYLGKKMFPNYNFFGPKKNANGIYQL